MLRHNLSPGSDLDAARRAREAYAWIDRTASGGLGLSQKTRPRPIRQQRPRPPARRPRPAESPSDLNTRPYRSTESLSCLHAAQAAHNAAHGKPFSGHEGSQSKQPQPCQHAAPQDRQDAPGSPLTNAAVFPEGGYAWDFNYRGDLVFLSQARAQERARGLHVEDGWRYFVHGWTRGIAVVFHRDIPAAGPGVDELSRLARVCREKE